MSRTIFDPEIKLAKKESETKWFAYGKIHFTIDPMWISLDALLDRLTDQELEGVRNTIDQMLEYRANAKARDIK